MTAEESSGVRVHNVGTQKAEDKVYLDPIGADEGTTILDMLEAALSGQVEREPLKLTVPSRPEITMVFDISTVDYDMYQAWIKRGNRGNKKNDPVGMDHMIIAVLAISHTNVGLLINGKAALRDGDPLTIKHASVHKMLKVAEGSTQAAIKKLYGLDGHAIQTMNQILEAAGFSLDGDVEQADPLDL